MKHEVYARGYMCEGRRTEGFLRPRYKRDRRTVDAFRVSIYLVSRLLRSLRCRGIAFIDNSQRIEEDQERLHSSL